MYYQLIYDRGRQNIQWNKYSIFNKCCWENWKATFKRMKVEHYLTPYTKIYSKWIKDLNIRPDTVKLLEKNIGRMLFDIYHSNILFDPSPRIMTVKTQINQWDLIRLKNFCTAKETIKNEKTTHRMGENICKWCNRQVPNLQNVLKNSCNLTKTKIQLKNRQKT